MSSAVKRACRWFLIQIGKKYLLFKEYLNGDFSKGVDSNECYENAGCSPNASCLPCVLHSTGHTIYVSVIKSRGTGFVRAETEVCGYSCGVTAPVSICKLCWYEGDFVLHAEHVDAIEVPACDSSRYKSIQILICCRTPITSVMLFSMHEPVCVRSAGKVYGSLSLIEPSGYNCF